MTWFLYKLRGWEIAVDAMNAIDAGRHIKIHAPGAQFQGEFTPPSWDHPSMATAMTTERRQAQISARAKQEAQDAGF